ncbi:MAG: ISL3 family transposase [Acetobacteraceae bacterium]
MVTSSLAPLCVTGLRLEGGTLFLDAAGEGEDSPCPGCGCSSRRVQARYRRFPLDLPWRGFVVRLAVMVRRFRCDNEACARRTFAETFGAILGRRRRFTTAVRAILGDVAAALGGRAGARLAERQGAPASRDTLLRILRSAPAQEASTPRVLGVDDLALRRGHRYATLLMDMETHEPIDLLTGRAAAVFADWLKEHPGVEVIVRDRGGAYAEGARQGAPGAKQVADRFHLAQNVSDALDEVIKRRRWAAPTDEEDASGADAAADPATSEDAIVGMEATPAGGEEPDRAADDPAPSGTPQSAKKRRQAERRAARVVRWRRVHELHAQGASLSAIARDLALDRTTVKRLLDAPEPPHNVIVHPRPGGISSPKLAPYTAYLQRRWREGCTNGCELFRGLVGEGYTGSRTLLLEVIRSWRPPKLPRPLRQRASRRRVDPRKRRWLLLRPPDQLNAEEQTALRQVLDADPELANAHTLVQRFRALLRARDLDGFRTWLTHAQASGLASFVGVANGMVKDRDAVEAAFTEVWSNGAVEGTVHKVKLLKRQAYGRANLDLLRCRLRPA